jgi:hypothetical protein
MLEFLDLDVFTVGPDSTKVIARCNIGVEKKPEWQAPSAF